MSDPATHSGRKRPAQKKWPLRRAAKFREETPRKGGGLAIKDRDTALQQYADAGTCLQGKSKTIPDIMPQKAWENSRPLPEFSATAAFMVICASQ